MLANRTARLVVVAACSAASIAAVAADTPLAEQGGGGGFGNGGDSITQEEAGFTAGGDAYASIDVSADGAGTSGAGGSWSWPVNITVYGKPVLHIPVAVGGGVTPFDAYCFRISYSTSHIDTVGELQVSANGGFEVAQDRDYLEPAEAAYKAGLKAYEDRVVRRNEVSATNEEARAHNGELAEGEEPALERSVPPLLPLPVEPVFPFPFPFPLPLCPGTPGTVPDLVPAFQAAADALESVDAPDLCIEPGHGITGLEAYLTTGRPMVFTHDVQTLSQLGWDLTDDPLAPTAISGTVEFEGAGTYVVDWGDGIVSPPQTVPGATFAQAQAGEVGVTHSYIDIGSYLITATDTWRVKMDVEFLGTVYTFVHEETLVPWAYPGGFDVDEVRSRRDS
ncbi:MAG: hypothetical protein ACI9AD_001125 [Nitriliruptoraceae bacterium]